MRPLLFQNYMLQWVYNSNGGAIPWHTRLLLLVSAAALAPTLAPLVLSLRVTISTSSTPALAWTAVLAQIPAPTAQSFPRTNSLGIHKNLVSIAYEVFLLRFAEGLLSIGYPSFYNRRFLRFSPLTEKHMLRPCSTLAGRSVFFYNGRETTRNEVAYGTLGIPKTGRIPVRL